MAFTLFSTNKESTTDHDFLLKLNNSLHAMCLLYYRSMGTFAGVRRLDKVEWTPMMEQALNVIYSLAEHPEKLAENLIKKIAADMLGEDKATPDEEQESQDKENGKTNPII